MSIETEKSETLIKHEEAYPTGNASIEGPSISEETSAASTKSRPFPSNTRHQPTVTVSLNDEDEDYIDRSSDQSLLKFIVTLSRYLSMHANNIKLMIEYFMAL